MKLGRVCVRICPHCGERNRRATGAKALWTNPYFPELCTACGHPLDGSKASVAERVMGFETYLAYYFLCAFVGFAVFLFGTALLVGWALPEPINRYSYVAMGIIGAVFGLWRADRTRRRAEILERHVKD